MRAKVTTLLLALAAVACVTLACIALRNREHVGPRLSCGSVDVVYTWVNGSDPVHVAALRNSGKKTAKREKALLSEAAREQDDAAEREEPGRYRDYDVLRYSMRSVFWLFPLARRVHLVVADGEATPWWLDTSDERIRVVRHSAIMPKDALPTFNSNAIETNLHLIHGLAECFVYLNDDMLFGRLQPTLNYYWDAAKGVQKVHFGVWVAPMTERLDNNNWHMAVARSNDRLSQHYGKASRPYPLHGCYFFHTAIFAKMRSVFAESYEATLRRKFRSRDDNVVSFIYPHVAVAEFGAYEGAYQMYYAALRANAEDNLEPLRYLVRRRPLCACINDDLGKSMDVSATVEQLHQALELVVPHPAPWEKNVKPMAPFDHSRFDGSLGVEVFVKVLAGAPAFVFAGLAGVAQLYALWQWARHGTKRTQ